MPGSKTASTQLSSRTAATRRRVLDAAERLLQGGSAEFSMRELAAEAGVSFATPFNQFGSKPSIMHALSAQRIDAMVHRFEELNPDGDAADRVLIAVDIAVAVMMADPKVNRAVIGTLGAPGGEAGQVYARSRALWAKAVGDGDGFSPRSVDLARSVLPGQLAVAFRGVLSFWTAGEISDAGLAGRARETASASLLGFVDEPRRTAILVNLSTPPEIDQFSRIGSP